MPGDGSAPAMQTTESGAPGAMAGASRQVLTFSLGGETYGVDILRVKEIRGWSPVTRIPRSSPAVLGVLNLRGAIVPIIDLRVRFALREVEFTPVTVIIVLSLRTADGQRECGIVVDGVKDVADITPENVRPAPSMSAGDAGEFIDGITTCDDKMLILLDADRLVSRDLAAASATPVAA
jgi:purine-binding chemotaxis protein CheW